MSSNVAQSANAAQAGLKLRGIRAKRLLRCNTGRDLASSVMGADDHLHRIKSGVEAGKAHQVIIDYINAGVYA